jgi:hypothetical protein
MPQGPKALRAVALVFAVAAWLAACGGYARDIEAVKQSSAPTGLVNEELVEQFAGARGKATWSAERPEKYKDNEHIVLVRATVDRIGRSGSKHQVVLDWIHNRQTEKIDLERVTVDGEEQSLVGGALQFLLLQLD